MVAGTDNIEDIYELSPMQRGMLFHTLYDPHSGVYIEQAIQSIEGLLDSSAFYEAWQCVIARHATLRTAFLWEELDEPMQVVYEMVEAPWERYDWREVAPATQIAQLEEMLAADRVLGFDLATPPLLRLTLLRIADKITFLILTYHHLLLDGWSLNIVLQEVLGAYEMLRAGQEPHFKDRRPYRDYMAWLQRQNLAEAEHFWRRYLQDFTSPIPLLLDRLDVSMQDSTFSTEEAKQENQSNETGLDLALAGQLRGGRPVELQGFTLSLETTEALRAFARQHGLTLNTLVQGAWALLLSRCNDGTGDSPGAAVDIVFGATVSGRPMNLSGSEAMVGLFINTLPVRVQVDPRAELVPWLMELQIQQAEARQYEYSPLVQVHGWSEIPRGQPLFESLLVFENYHVEQQSGDGEESAEMQVRFLQSLEQTNYPLVLIVSPAAELDVQLGYETARFTSSAMHRTLSLLRTLLEGFLAHPNSRLMDISLINEAERQQLLSRWNEAAIESPYEQNSNLSHLLQQQVTRTPDAIALVCPSRPTQDEDWQHITYCELDVKANQLAHYLLRCGVGPEVHVALCMERSPELLVGLLAILKAGAAYVPLDPGYPQERLAFMLADAQRGQPGNDQPLLLLTQQKLLDRLSALQTAHIQAICFDSIWDVIQRERTEAPAIHIFPDNAAYVIYTSGSTGVPKGVIVTQESLLHHCLTVGERYELAASDRVLQFASISFDVALEEILPSWTRGATVVMWPEPIAPSPTDFTRFVLAEQLTVLNLPSSYWHQWVAELARLLTPQAQRPVSIRLMVVGSERVSPSHFMAWHNVMGQYAVWLNAYGLTETTITTLVYEPGDESVEEQMAAMPVGMPLAGMQIFVLDARQQPVPEGMPGELYIGGVGLTRGYLHRPDLTAERFVPHPFSEKAGARLYRTGDLVRVRQDNTSSAPDRAYLEFLGRADTQVKVRGFRVELGEIEALLSKHAAVSEVVVLAREDNPGDSRLVAYIIPAQRSPFLVAQLRTYLQKKLPAYMIPSSFVLLDTFPHSPSGKINRRALPAPEHLHIHASEEYVAPRTPLEEMLAVIWASVMRLERVSRTDNFFKLGGHSLQGTQVVARLREVLQIELPVRAIYDAPTITALAVTVEKIRQSKQGSAIPSIRPVERTDMLPLSYAQQRLWFLDQLQPGSPFYTMSNAFIVGGSLQVKALEQSINDLMNRHEILRTSFPMVDEQPVQRIAPTSPLPFFVVDLSGLPLGVARESEVQRLLREVTRLSFDLQHGPLLRLLLLRLSVTTHALALTLHHMIADGWSSDIFFHELDAFYTAHTGGQPVMLSEMPLQYADYAVWQREWLSAFHWSDEKEQEQSDILETQMAYWREQLRGAPTQLELPVDHSRPAVQTLAGANVAFTLPASLSQQLQTLSQEEGVTLFMLLLAAFQVLLSCYSGQTDIVVGTPVAGRVRRETEQLIGLFLNTLALRTDLSGEISFRELLGRVREVSLGAYMHQDIPFEKLVEELQPERSMSQSPLFQVFFVLQNVQSGRVKLADLRLEPIGVSSETAKFDLAMEMVTTPDGLEGVVEYNSDLFEAATIQRMIGHYETLLQSVVTNIEQPVPTLPLLTLSERQQLQAWNETDRQYPYNHLLHALFEAQAERTPDSVALVFEGQQMSYRELNERANRLAHFLQKLGTGPDMVVGLCLDRSLELVVGMLGVLKAGAAYLPLDPEYPQERLAWVLADAQASVVLTHQPCHDVVSACLSQAKIIDLDSQWQEIMVESEKNPSSMTTAENLAYVIYTSGSTGQPKGVMISHRAICNRLLWMQEDFLPFAGTDRILQKTPFSFDASVVEFFAPLLAGSCLILARPQSHRESSYLIEAIAREHITILHLVPTLLRTLLEEPDIAQCRCLQRVHCGGEELSVDLQERFFSTVSAKLYNFYGPTECAVDSSVWTCEPQAQQIPIGLPIANMQMYVLGPQLQLMPIGVPGELYIGGVGLARGYRNRPNLTAETFVPHPFSDAAGERLYKTGDLARRLPNGSIEFLGRADFQTKLRGFRIELQEIEAALGAHPGLRENAVVVREDTIGDQRLVAYIVPKAEQAPSPAELRSSLREQLPAYMLPSIFVTMQQLPLTMSGKVDRSALPMPQYGEDIAGSSGDGGDKRTAFQPYEEVLTSIWADILRSGRPAVGQNFFDLGGHSLLATRMIARVRRIFQIDVPLRAVFEAPTLAELARWIESARNGAVGETPTPPLLPCSREKLLSLSYAQERLWFLSQLEPENPAYNIPFALRVHGMLNLDALEEGLNALVQRHEALRTTFVVHDGLPYQVITPSLPLNLRVIDLSHLAILEREQEVQRHSTYEALQPFDLSGAILWRCTLLHLDTNEHVLLLTIHHSIADAWSLDILLNELSVIYNAVVAGTAYTLPELPLQYADYAVWQREWLQGESLERQVTYWREQLRDAPTVLDLPPDHPRPAVQSYRGDICSFTFSPTLSLELQALSKQESVTLFMTLLAALQVLLLRYSGQEDIVIGTPIAGRTREELAGIVGNFVNTLALRTDLSGNPSFRDVLARVREVCLQAYARQDVPFEKVVEIVQPERSLSHHPLFQVMLLLQHASGDDLALPGLNLEPLVFDNPTTKFDLTVEFVETSGGLQGAVEYNTDIFERQTIERLVKHFQQLLIGIIANPNQRLSMLPLMSGEEEHHLLTAWNTTATSDISPFSAHQLFAQQAARNPGAVAVTCRHEELTYAQLNHRSNQLAHVLHKLGVRPEKVVGLFMERSLETVVAVLGILKAGGAYVPLDPIYPAERLAFMLQETRTTVLLTQHHMLAKLPPYDGQVICVDSLNGDRETLSDEDALNPDYEVTPANLAYIIYTSGSTGLPKGVMVTHGGLSNYLGWCIQAYHIELGRGSLLHSSLASDLTVTSLFAPLLAGQRLEVLPEEEGIDALGNALGRSQDLSMVKVTPAHLTLLAGQLAREDTAHCTRAFIIGGEALLPEHVAFWRSIAPETRLINEYGPTETVVGCCVYEVGPGDDYTARSVIPIGRPIANTQLYLLDAELHPVPVGVHGELYIAGAGVARGYLNRPDLTAERFLPHPFSDEPGARCYRTGDVARYLPDGTIEFLGRTDSQLKLRGYRIEPGEIETVLKGHEDVQEAVVMLEERDITAHAEHNGSSGPGKEKRLVAYLIGQHGTTLSFAELRAYLHQRLPDYMIPALCVQLDTLPLLPNGKVDRRRLATLSSTLTSPESGMGEGEPRNSVEEALVAIWGQVLGRDHVGIYDNFFDLGGHSLLITQVISRVRQSLQIELPLRTLFEKPTIADFAGAIVQQELEQADSDELLQLLAEMEEFSL